MRDGLYYVGYVGGVLRSSQGVKCYMFAKSEDGLSCKLEYALVVLKEMNLVE